MLRYQDPIQHYRVDAAFYDYFAEDPFRRVENRRRYEAIFHFLKPRPGQRVLEVGSGGGPGLPLIRKRGIRYVPLDLAEVNLWKLQEKESTLLAVCGDGGVLPFCDGVFDGVILSEVLEHLEDPVVVLREAWRVLKVGGRIVVTVPYRERITYQICIHCNRPTPTNAHLHAFGPESLQSLVRQAGFAIVHWERHCNKIPNRLSLYRWMAGLPFWVWHVVDRCFHALIDKPATLVLCGTKPVTEKG